MLNSLVFTTRVGKALVWRSGNYQMAEKQSSILASKGLFSRRGNVAFMGVMASLILAACSVKKEALPIGGSRADGTVDMAFEIGDMQTAEVDWVAAQSLAEQRCAAWGYTAAEKFGGEQRQCSAPSGYGCYAWQVKVTYQCTGGKPVIQSQ